MKIRLSEIAHARSGDKADRADIGLFAWDATGYALIEEGLTSERVAAHFAHLLARPGVQSVERYPLPRLLAIKWVLNGALGGGAASSLRRDNRGKTVGSLLLPMTRVVAAARGLAALAAASP
ncbi:MAG: hypothetical protein ACKODU_06945, partial [Limnohabitans sp.]